jgi:hypothetical protein
MQIKVKRKFRYETAPGVVAEIAPGVHDLPDELAYKVLKFGRAEKVYEKRAPENKVVAVAEHKAGLDGATVRRRRKRTKPDA